MPMLLFLAAAVQAAPLMAVPPAPPVIMVAPSRTMQGPPITIDVEARASGEILWSGQMRVSGRSGASFSRQQTNADAAPCNAVDGYYDGGLRNSLSINMSMMQHTPIDEGVNVRVNWDRPSDGGSCQTRRGMRTVALNETVVIKQGETVTVNGDGGLTVRLRRR